MQGQSAKARGQKMAPVRRPAPVVAHQIMTSTQTTHGMPNGCPAQASLSMLMKLTTLVDRDIHYLERPGEVKA